MLPFYRNFVGKRKGHQVFDLLLRRKKIQDFQQMILTFTKKGSHRWHKFHRKKSASSAKSASVKNFSQIGKCLRGDKNLIGLRLHFSKDIRIV